MAAQLSIFSTNSFNSTLPDDSTVLLLFTSELLSAVIDRVPADFPVFAFSALTSPLVPPPLPNNNPLPSNSSSNKCVPCRKHKLALNSNKLTERKRDFSSSPFDEYPNDSLSLFQSLASSSLSSLVTHLGVLRPPLSLSHSSFHDRFFPTRSRCNRLLSFVAVSLFFGT